MENRDSPGSRETRVNRILKNIVALARARWEQAQEVMPAWGATGIVFAAMLVVAGLLVLVARSKFRRRGFQVVRDLGQDFITMRESLRREA